MLSDRPVADGVQLIIYADDITILSKGDTLTEVRACLQSYLDSLAAWFKKWKLIVNPAKCSQQIFTKKHSIPDVILRLNNSVVRNVTCHRVLGIVFDAPRLTFAAHMGNLVGDLRKRLQVLRALSAARWGASRLLLRRVYIAFTKSKLEYGWPAWGMLRSSSLKKLTVIQNTALRNILGVRKTSLILSLEVESRIPPLELQLQLLTARRYIRLMNRGNHDYTLKQLGLSRRGQQTVFETQARQVLVSMNALIPRRVRTGTLSRVPPWNNFPNFISVDAPCRTAYHGQEAVNEAIMQEDLNAKYSGFTQIFTDGSKLSSGSTAAALFVPSLAQAVGWKLNAAHTALGAELFGIHQALTFANKHPALHNKGIVILSDSQSALHMLKNIWNPNYRHIVYDI
ncbi:Reverse transcriptase domain [Trinorchestia longiramus]|nr:Reverse transcriptase domain [Trinorchestia longiramus]